MSLAQNVGHPSAQGTEEIQDNVKNVAAQMVIENLTVQPQEKVLAPEPKALDIVFRGSFEEVNDHFYEKEWSDGLPIVPPTMAKIQAFQIGRASCRERVCQSV